MEYVAWYLIISGITSLVAAVLFCWYGYMTPTLYINDRVDEEQEFIDHINLEHKRLEEYWMWRRDESDG